MSQEKFSELFTKLHKDGGFRSRFAKDPAAALRAEGFDTSKLALPKKIDLAQLDQKLERLFSGREAYVPPTPEVAGRMSADELWSKFGIIGGSQAATDVPIVVAVVAYGAAATVGTPSVVVGRSPAAERRHTVLGPDNMRVEDLHLDEVADLFIKVGRKRR
ncbi:MAG: hypothetical protein AB1Z98_32780 [Nannocystaceae bacterium]